MPDKSPVFWDFVYALLVLPVVGWLGYLQNTKIDATTCEATKDGMCAKIDSMHDDVREIRHMMIEHIRGK